MTAAGNLDAGKENNGHAQPPALLNGGAEIAGRCDIIMEPWVERFADCAKGDGADEEEVRAGEIIDGSGGEVAPPPPTALQVGGLRTQIV